MSKTHKTHTRWLPALGAAATLVASASAAHAQPTLSKVFTPSTIGPGSVSTITFTITNGSALPVTGLAFTDNLPAAITLADPANASTDCDLGTSGSLSAPDGGSTIALSDAQLGGLQACTVTVDVTASTPGMHTNPAITLNSSAPGSSMSLPVDLTVTTALPGFSKSFAPSSVSLGGKSTLTFLIDNTANGSNVDNLDFTDNLPAGMEIADPANASTTCGTATIPPTLTATAGTTIVTLDANGTGGFPAVASGATCTVTVDVTTTGAGGFDNVSVELLAEFVSAGKASATLEVTVTALAIQKAFTDDPTPPGGAVTLEFRIDNFDRDFAATAVAFSDDLTTALAGLTFDSVLANDCGGTVMGAGTTMITFSGGTVAAEGFCTLRLSLTVPAGATPGVYTNTSGAVTATVDGSPVAGNAASDDLFVEPAPVLTKEFLEVGTLNPDPVVSPGDDVVLRFTVTNTSATSGATDVEFIDELTDGGPGTGFLPFPVSVVLPGGSPCGGSVALVSVGTDRQALELTGGSLATAGMAGDSCAFDVTLSIPATLGPGIYLNTTEEPTATVDGATRTGEPASDTLTVVAAPGLSKAFTDDPVAPGGTVTLEFTLNYDPDASGDATGITFTDNLAPVLAGLTATGLPLAQACDPDGPGGNPGTGTLSGSAGDTLLTFMGGTLSPGESCTFSVTLDVPVGAAPGTYTNTTSGVGATVDGVAATSAAAEDDLKVAGLVVTKEFLGDPVIAGDAVTLRFTIDNVHPTDDATSIRFTDDLATVLPGTPDLSSTGPPTANSCGGGETGSSTFLDYQGGSLMAGMTCTVDYEILVPAGAADGAYNNTTGFISAIQSGGAVFPENATDTLTIESNLLLLVKAFTDDPVAPGDTVTLEFTLTNLDATQAASMIDFTDDLSTVLPGTPDLTFDSVLFNDCGATVSGTGTDMITVTGAALGVGGTCTIRVSLTVPAGAAAGVYPNTTSGVTGTIGGFAVSGDAASDDLRVLQLLLFSKSFDGPTTATGTAMLSFTITNPGAATASDIAFTDDLDAVIPGLIATSLPALPCGAGSSIAGIGFLAFSGGELPPLGGICSFDVEVLVPASATAGTFPNVTSELFRAGLPVADPATADLTIEPPPTFAKVFMPDAITAGGTSTLVFTIDNGASALDADDLDFTDNLPAAVVVSIAPNASTTCAGGAITAVAGTGTIAYSGGSVGAGASCTVQADVTSAVPGAHVNVTGDLTSSSGNSGTATDTLTVLAVDLAVTKTDGVTSAVPGESVTYTIVASNAGPGDEPAASLTDVFPAELTCTYTSVAAGGASGNTPAGAGDLAETLSLPAGSSVTYTVDCAIDPAATGTLSNTATIAGTVFDATPGNNSATDDDTVLVPEADLAVVKDGPASVTVGEQLTYTLTVTNNGPSVATGVTLDDPTPAGLTFVSATAPCAGGFPCALGSLDVAEEITVDVTFEVPFDYAGADPIVNAATVSGDAADNVPANDSDDAETDVTFDTEPPVVTGVATADGPLAVCDTVRSPITVIEVTIEDDLAPIENAGDVGSYLLVEAGPDRDFSTAACGGAAGDDLGVAIDSVTLLDTPPTAVAELNFAAPLAAGLYRLLVCDLITDAAGNALDGDGDSTPGGDFVLSFFRADPLNLFENGHFDDCPVTLDPWVLVATAPNAIVPGTPGADDFEASPLSASAFVAHSAADASSLAQCVEVDAGTAYTLSARWRFDPPMGALALLAQTCELFDAAACGGTGLGSTTTVSILEDEGGAWQTIASEVAVPAGAVSALCDFTTEAIGGDVNYDLYLDALSLTADGALSLIFSDGFESAGDTSAWSSSTEP